MYKIVLAAAALLSVGACSYTSERTQAYSAPIIAPDGTDVSGAGIYIAPQGPASGLVVGSGLNSRPDDPNGTGTVYIRR